MRELYNEFFYISKHGKIREKVMLARTAITVAIMVICLAAMSITAYTYFSYNITSGSNIVKAANFEAKITVTNTYNGETVEPSSTDGKKTAFTLANGEYTVELEKGDSTADTGFCIVTIGDTEYYTQQIGVDVWRGLTDGSASVKFTLIVPSDTTITIEILSHWGTSSYYASDNPRYIDSDDFVIDLTPVGNDDSLSDEGSSAAESTASTGASTMSTTESTTPSTGQTPPESTGTSESTSMTEPSNTTEPYAPTNTTESATTEPTDTTATEETQPTQEITGAPTREASE